MIDLGGEPATCSPEELDARLKSDVDMWAGVVKKASGGYRLGPHSKDYARELLRVAGPDRLVWASDCPFVGHEGQFPYHSTIDWLVDAIPEANARAKIFGETARALYFNGA
jgi:predicted TIM-barrel fold metal-dependent hydrolase